MRIEFLPNSCLICGRKIIVAGIKDYNVCVACRIGIVLNRVNFYNDNTKTYTCFCSEVFNELGKMQNHLRDKHDLIIDQGVKNERNKKI